MKYKIKVSEIKKRAKFSLYEIQKNLQKFALTFTHEEAMERLVMFKTYKNKDFVRTSVSFIHNRCVVSLRRGLYFVCLSYLAIKLSNLVHMAELLA